MRAAAGGVESGRAQKASKPGHIESCPSVANGVGPESMVFGEFCPAAVSGAGAQAVAIARFGQESNRRSSNPVRPAWTKAGYRAAAPALVAL